MKRRALFHEDGRLTYFTGEGDAEVDFVLQHGDTLVAIEVKSGQQSFRRSGNRSFCEKVQPFAPHSRGQSRYCLGDVSEDAYY